MEAKSEAFQLLQRALATAQREGEFPDWLATDIQAILRQPENYPGKEFLVRTLTAQIRDYDPYAGSGCFSDSCGIGDLERTLSQLGIDHQEEIN